jgi:hypothetical protein
LFFVIGGLILHASCNNMTECLEFGLNWPLTVAGTQERWNLAQTGEVQRKNFA